MKKYLTAAAIIIIFSLMFTLCILFSSKEADYVDDGIANIDFSGESESNVDTSENDDQYDYYVYPDNPIESLKSYLETDIKERSLPIKIGDIVHVEDAWSPQKEFTLSFTNNPDDACVISFATNKYYLLDGKDNPSFIIAFKDPDNSKNMITLLTSVIMYLSPELSFGEAREIAANQDETISTDGYSMPQDIGGYQIQARYTNPHIFFAAREFESKMGVEITALRQIWGEPNTQNARELIYPQDYSALTAVYSQEDESLGRTVYADFIIKNVWQHVERIHGDFWETVDVESVTGQQFTLRVETMRMPMDYKFGVGQQYTLYVYTGSYYGPQIYYAIQRTTVNQYGSRGELQPMDYSTNDWENPPERIEPEGDGVIHDVYFNLIRQGMISEPAAVLEGHGVGEKQWPNDPKRDGYEFAGWYDNEELAGTLYSKDTPIYQDTDLYAKWRYIGPGGAWPRSHHGIINGIAEEDSFDPNQEIFISAEGYNMHLVMPDDQRFRWIPVGWKVSDKVSGEFSVESPFSTKFSIDTQGKYTLYIVYKEEIFDGLAWQETGQMREVEERIFTVK